MSGAIKIKTAERAYAKINLFLEITGKKTGRLSYD